MKIIRLLGFLLFFIPCATFAVPNAEFQNASRLLSAARRGDVQTVQILVNSGVNVNYVDATGLSLVCTAVMNNDARAIQILQSYGADASNCDRQIKQYNQKMRLAAKGEEYGFFSGLSSTHIVALAAVGVAAVVGGVALLTNVFDGDGNKNSSSGTSGDRPNNNPGTDTGTTTNGNNLFAQNLPYGPACADGVCPDDFTVWQNDEFNDFTFMSTGTNFNYLMVARAYNAFVRGYLGAVTVRNDSSKEPFDLFNHNKYPFAQELVGGKPINVATITASGVNATGSAGDNIIYWFNDDKNSLITNCLNSDGTYSEACVAAVNASVKYSHKYANLTGATVEDAVEDFSFNLSESGTVFGSATTSDTTLAKIVAGWEADGRESGQSDYYGFIPNGQLSAYKIGIGASGVMDYKNYKAIYDALTRKDSSGNYITNVIANLAETANAGDFAYATIDGAKISNDAATNDALKKTAFLNLIDTYYNLNTADDGTVNKPSVDADKAFADQLSQYQKHILVNPAGHGVFKTADGVIHSAQSATFENFAPVVYNGLQNLFATVVAVKPANGTLGTDIDDYSAAGAGKLELSVWADENTANTYNISRTCGLSGTGNAGAMNPWCFAAPGNTDLEATAAMAGAFALVSSAFNYMEPQEVFLLLALTADGPYLGINPNSSTGYSKWSQSDKSDLVAYLDEMYTLPPYMNTDVSQYLESFKNVFGYGMINIERATRPGTNIYYYGSSSNKYDIVASGGSSYWGLVTTSSGSGRTGNTRASSVLSLANGNDIRVSFFDVLESADGTISLPRVWNTSLSMVPGIRHGLYMGDVLGDFNVDKTNKRSNRIGNIGIDMAMSHRAYNDNMNGLDDLHVSFSTNMFDVDAQYQHYLTNGLSRFDGRANSLLALTTNAVSYGAKYKYGRFGFGGHSFFGAVSDDALLDSDPVISNQFEPGRLGNASGVYADIDYNGERFGINVSFGNMNESDTVLGSYSDGLMTLRGANTKYLDVVSEYKPFENVKLMLRGTVADTQVSGLDGIVCELSNIKSNAFAGGIDVGGFSFTAAMPLAVVNGRMGYDYADLSVVMNNGQYTVVANNPHVEYVDLAAAKREYRFSGYYKHALGDFTDAGVGFIYRVNPNNTDAFGNESVLMMKLHHRLGI